MNFQFNKSVVFSHDPAQSKDVDGNTCNSKRWLTLSHVSGKGSHSPFQQTPYEYQADMLFDTDDQVMLRNIVRIILSNETNKLLQSHIKKSLKLSVEIMVGDGHFLGFIDLEELLIVGRKRIRASVPLIRFANLLLTSNSDCQSVFAKPKSILKARKAKKDTDRKSVKTASSEATEAEEAQEVPFLNAEGKQVFIVVEVELEKPINVEVYEDSHEQLLPARSSQTEPKLSQLEKLKSFGKDLQLVTKNIFKIYDQESDVNKITSKMLNDGYFTAIENHLLPAICEIGKEKLSIDDDFDGFRADFMCQLTSQVINENSEPLMDKKRKLLMAKVYDFFDMEEKSNEVFLQLIHEDSSEQNWIHYAVHNLRKEKFSKALACIDEALKLNQISIVGHILNAYICFKLQKYSECERMAGFVQFKHGDSVELSMIHHFVNIKKNLKGAASCCIGKHLTTHHKLQHIYDSREVLWFATSDVEKFLSWQDPFIRSAIFFTKLGCFEFAELALSKYYSRYGANVNYSYLLAVIDAMKGKYQDSLFHLNKLSKQDVANHQLNFENIIALTSLMLLKLGKFESAEKLCNITTSFKNQRLEFFLVFFMFGAQHKESGEQEKALHLMSEAHHIFPSELTLMELGKCYHSLNKLSLASKCFQQVINYECNSTDAWQHLYEIYIKKNRMELVKLCNA